LIVPIFRGVIVPQSSLKECGVSVWDVALCIPCSATEEQGAPSKVTGLGTSIMEGNVAYIYRVQEVVGFLEGDTV